jgi:hypothetical protein
MSTFADVGAAWAGSRAGEAAKSAATRGKSVLMVTSGKRVD